MKLAPILFFFAGVSGSAISLACLGTPSVVCAFIASMALWLFSQKLQAQKMSRVSALLLFGACAWGASSWWLSTGIHSMNQSYWWTGYFAAGLSAVWGGIPYTILGLCSAKASTSSEVKKVVGSAAAITLAIELWPHPFPGNVAVGVTGSSALIQIVEIGGTPLLLFVLHLSAFLAAEGFLQFGLIRRKLWSLAVCIVLCWWVGGWQRFELYRRQDANASQVRIGAVQPNIPIEGVLSIGKVGDKMDLARRTRELLKAEIPPDVVVWPEIPIYFSPTNSPDDREFVNFTLQNSSIPLLLNADMYTNETIYDRVPFYNTVEMFRGSGVVEQEYRKHLLIPIGEYLPFESLMTGPNYERILSGLRRYVPGTEITLFSVTTSENIEVRIGTPICLELLSSTHVQSMVKHGATLLVSPANDIYFRNEAAARLGLAFAVFRAVEYRTPVVRVTNSGMTSVIQASGEALANGPLPPFEPAHTTFNVAVSKSAYQFHYSRTIGFILTGCMFLLTLVASAKPQPTTRAQAHPTE